MVVDLATLDHRHRIVKQVDDRAHEARLGLTAFAEQDQVVAREDAAFEPRQDRVVEAEDAGEELVAALELRQQVRAELLLDGAVLVAGGAELADRGRRRHGTRVRARTDKGPPAGASGAAARVAAWRPPAAILAG